MNFINKTNNILLFFLLQSLTNPIYSASSASQKQKDFTPEIQKIVLSDDSVFYDKRTGIISGYNEMKKDLAHLVLTPNLNAIFFEFDSRYGEDEEIFYQYFLSGFDEGWSRWTKYSIKEYTNLKKGKYKFRARAKTLDNQLSQEFTFDLKILPPIHRTIYAYFVYIIFVFILSWMIIRIRSFQFAKERFRLEMIINERTEELVNEKDKSENLLANVLPKDTADELKSKGKVTKKKYKMATILFSDIQGFTKIAEQMNPETLIDELDKFFFHFDSVVEKYNIEKIKTIGDAYMCAGGIPNKNRTNPVEVVLAALEMQQYMRDLQLQAKAKNQEYWDIRIGIHTGSLIAGVVGHKKLSYDIWGDSVNTASRMESSGEAGKVNISGSTYELVRDFFICEYRGKMPVKYKGEIDMYFVTGIRPELSVDLKGLPNQQFLTQLQLLRLNDFEEEIVEKLETELPENLYFHNVKHTMNVATQAELIGRAEGISEEDMLLVRTAALLHDTGFIKTYEEHEKESYEIGKEMLPRYKYSDAQIEKICNLIMATEHPLKPKNLLEEIIFDADLAYYGRIDYIPALQNLYKELLEQKMILATKDWYQNQIKILTEHEFFTKTGRLLRDLEKEKQIQNITELMNS